jgi:hypothetical protein
MNPGTGPSGDPRAGAAAGPGTPGTGGGIQGTNPGTHQATTPGTHQGTQGAHTTTQTIRSDAPSERGISAVRHDESEGSRRDRIRWGPVWAGLVVAIATYLLLQLLLVAVGLVDVGALDTADAAWSAAAALVAFLLGGITAGATAMWNGVDDGLLHGVVMWAIGLVVLVAFSALSSGLALGAIDTTEVFEGVTATDVEEALEGDDPQDAAGQALLGLTAALIASALGGVIGAKLWPQEREGGRVVMSRSSGTPLRREESTRQEVRR